MGNESKERQNEEKRKVCESTEEDNGREKVIKEETIRVKNKR